MKYVRRYWLCVAFFVVALLLLLLAGDTPIFSETNADPAYCYSSGKWIEFPEYSGYCEDGGAPFYGPGPSYGGGNHRWPDGSDN